MNGANTRPENHDIIKFLAETVKEKMKWGLREQFKTDYKKRGSEFSPPLHTSYQLKSPSEQCIVFVLMPPFHSSSFSIASH